MFRGDQGQFSSDGCGESWIGAMVVGVVAFPWSGMVGGGRGGVVGAGIARSVFLHSANKIRSGRSEMQRFAATSAARHGLKPMAGSAQSNSITFVFVASMIEARETRKRV